MQRHLYNKRNKSARLCIGSRENGGSGSCARSAISSSANSGVSCLAESCANSSADSRVDNRISGAAISFASSCIRSSALAIIGICSALGLATLLSPDTHALEAPNITISVQSPVGSNKLQPGSTGASLAHYQVPVDISITHAAKYAIYVSGTPALTGSKSDNTDTIVGYSGSLLDLSQQSNAWGYRYRFGAAGDSSDTIDNDLNAKTFTGITSASQKDTIADTYTADGSYDGRLTLEFGASVDGNIAADEYSGEVTLSIVATPLLATLFDITTMQEMTHDICKNTPTPDASTLGNATGGVENWATTDSTHYASTLVEASANSALVPQKTLTDTRDNKTYLVRKLADGNCWMSQNLELDFLGTGQSYYTGVTSDSAAPTSSNNDSNKTYYNTEADGRDNLLIDSGFRLTDADTDLHTTTVWTPDYVNQINAAKDTNYVTYTTITGARESSSPAYGWKNDGSDGLRSYNTVASSSDWAYNVLSDTGNSNTSASFLSSATGEAYQKTGNVYNWAATTLGSSAGLTTDGQIAQDSICPRGWKLPGVSGDGSFVNLLQTYDSAQNWQTGNNPAGFNKVNSSPLDFSCTGHYYYSYGYLYGREYTGHWQSDVFGSKTGTTHSLFVGSLAGTANGYIYSDSKDYPNGFGAAVRCVAR